MDEGPPGRVACKDLFWRIQQGANGRRIEDQDAGQRKTVTLSCRHETIVQDLWVANDQLRCTGPKGVPELYQVSASSSSKQDSSTHLVRCVSRVRSSIDSTTPYDAKYQNGVVDAVEGMNQHRVSLPDACVHKSRDQLSNQRLCLYRRDRIESIVGINVNLCGLARCIYRNSGDVILGWYG